MTDHDEIKRTLDSFVEAGVCSSRTASNIRLAMSAADRLGKKRMMAIWGIVSVVATPPLAAAAVAVPFTSLAVLFGGWSAVACVAGITLLIAKDFV